jgi:hypothetical protein
VVILTFPNVFAQKKGMPIHQVSIHRFNRESPERYLISAVKLIVMSLYCVTIFPLALCFCQANERLCASPLARNHVWTCSSSGIFRLHGTDVDVTSVPCKGKSDHRQSPALACCWTRHYVLLPTWLLVFTASNWTREHMGHACNARSLFWECNPWTAC